ncbi:SLAF5 protein, partial [Crotophaga sulcirostris]|nr:SLAF5 protein [Crotophaga sulcirostris]
SPACVSGEAEVTRAIGKSVTFHLQGLDETAIAWSFHNDIIVTVKPGSPPEVTFFDNSYKPRLTFPENGNALTISELRMKDAGTYTAKTATGKHIFTLHVYRELEVPMVTCSVLNCSAGVCSYILHCTAAGPGSGNVSYAWSMGRWLWTEGPTVQVEKLPSDESPLTCTAQNPVSSRNTTVTSLAAFCAGNGHGKVG